MTSVGPGVDGKKHFLWSSFLLLSWIDQILEPSLEKHFAPPEEPLEAEAHLRWSLPSFDDLGVISLYKPLWPSWSILEDREFYYLCSNLVLPGDYAFVNAECDPFLLKLERVNFEIHQKKGIFIFRFTTIGQSACIHRYADTYDMINLVYSEKFLASCLGEVSYVLITIRTNYDTYIEDQSVY